MDANEEYVRAKWLDVALWDRQMLYGNREQFWEVEIVIAPGIFSRHCFTSKLAAWQAAREFTEARLREIAEVDEEIVCLEVDVRRCERVITPIYQRTLSRLQSIRVELTKGMTPAGGKGQEQ